MDPKTKTEDDFDDGTNLRGDPDETEITSPAEILELAMRKHGHAATEGEHR